MVALVHGPDGALKAPVALPMAECFKVLPWPSHGSDPVSHPGH